MTLIDFLRKHQARKLGLTTDTIAREAEVRLEKAIVDELGRNVSPPVKSAALNLCGDRLDILLQIFRAEAIDNPERVSEKFVEVVCMYKDLTDRAYLIDHTTAREALRKGIGQMVPPRFRGTLLEIRVRRVLLDKSQLRRLRNPKLCPSSVDKTILAEAAYLHEKFNSQETTATYLSSADKMFSPNLDGTGEVVSSDITDEIWERFKVRCDWPERIASELKKIYG
jgi:hypothetical protein